MATQFSDPSRPFKPYHDIKWAHGQPLLFAASENPRVDVFQLS